MKLRTRTASPIRVTRPKVRLTETEILADLNYPAPAMTEEKTRRPGSAADGSH